MKTLTLFGAGLLGMLALPAHAEDAFIFKGGMFNLARDPQTINDVERDLDENGDDVYAFAWEKRRRDAVALGVEYVRFTHDWRSANTRGSAKSRAVLFTVKRYQDTGTLLYPFVGVGVGLAHADLSSMPFDSALGLALQLSAGAEWRWPIFGLYAEIKGLYGNPGEIYGDDYSSSGIGAFGGFTFRF